jgi:hypothetical protein
MVPLADRPPRPGPAGGWAGPAPGGAAAPNARSAGAHAGIERGLHRGLEPICLVAEIEGIAQRHGKGGCRRSGWPCPGRRCRGPSREPARTAPWAGRLAIGAPSDAEGSMPRLPVSIAASSDNRSPNRLSVTITSNCLGAAHQLHRAGIGIHVRQLHIRVIAVVHLLHHVAPQDARFHHIGLFHRTDLVALPRQFEGGAGDAGDLGLGIALGVDADPLIAFGAMPRGSPK